MSQPKNTAPKSKPKTVYTRCRMKVERVKLEDGESLGCQTCAEATDEYWSIMLGGVTVRACKRCVREIRRRLSVFLPNAAEEKAIQRAEEGVGSVDSD